MVTVGDKGLVIGAGSGDARYIPLETPEVGDTVILYSLKDETRIAVPTLSFGIGDFAFLSPSFQFAGFNWNINFDFQLLPLDLSFIGGDVTFIWNQVEYVSNWVNWGGYGQIWLVKRGDLVRKTVPFGYTYCAIKTDGDDNDGVAAIYLNNTLIDSICMHNAGVAWHRFSKDDLGGDLITKIEVKYTGTYCGGTKAEIAWIKFAFYNDPGYPLI